MQLTLDIDRMDTSGFTETWGYGLLLFAEADRLCLFADPAADTRQKAAVISASRLWLSKVRKSLSAMRPAASMRLLTILDFLHRLVYGSPFPGELHYSCVLRAFEAMQRGDRTVDRYELFGFISSAIRKKEDVRFLGSPLKWQKAEMAGWLEEIGNAGTGIDMPPYDRLMRVITMLRTDLERFGISDVRKFKNVIRRRHRHLLDDIPAEEAGKDYGFRTYYALGQLLTEYRDEMDADTYSGYEERVHAAIISSRDIDIYTKTYYESYLSRHLRRPVAGRARP